MWLLPLASLAVGNDSPARYRGCERTKMEDHMGIDRYAKSAISRRTNDLMRYPCNLPSETSTLG